MKPLENDLNYIVKHLAPVLPSLEKSKILITGGTGFFGKWLLLTFMKLIEENHKIEISVLSRNPEKFINSFPQLNQEHIKFIKGDIRNFAYPKEQFTHVIHGATAVDADMALNSPYEMLSTIIAGTEHLLEFCKSLATAPQTLLISSGAVYGNQPTAITHIPETYQGAPDIYRSNSTYGIGKYTAEHLCYQYHRLYDLPVKIARPFAFVGPYLPLDIHFAIGNFIRDALHGDSIQIKDDGTAIRSYQYAADLIIWLIMILTKGQSAYPYNVGSEEAYDLANIAQMISKKFPHHPKVIIGKEKKSAPVSQYVPSTQRITTELHVPANLSLDAALDRTILWYDHNKKA